MTKDLNELKKDLNDKSEKFNESEDKLAHMQKAYDKLSINLQELNKEKDTAVFQLNSINKYTKDFTNNMKNYYKGKDSVLDILQG